MMRADWCGLAWTEWFPLERAAISRTAPSLPGVYRIRRACRTLERLVYIGQTGRSLRERLSSLAAGTNADACPFNDPHTAAPHLWLLRTLEGVAFEYSGAPLPGDKPILRGTEDMLLWRHRIDTGVSTEANYGRFYPGYTRPTNRSIVSKGKPENRLPGRRAEPIREGTAAVDFSVERPPLAGSGSLVDAEWWKRGPLSDYRSLPPSPAVYIIHDLRSQDAVYIGETSNLAARAAAHAQTTWPLAEPAIAFLAVPNDTPKFVLRELESDLLGWHFASAGTPPACQYSSQPG